LNDPYVSRPELVMAPPSGFRERLRHLGPSLVVTGSVVGSGEIILTSSLGAVAGFGMLWWVLLSCWSKSIVQAEFARYVMTTGDTYIHAMNRLPGRIGPVSWVIWLGILAFIPGVTSMAGIVGGSGQAIALLFPAINDVTGAAVTAVVATLILGFSTYRRLEAWLIGMVVSFTACTLICALAMQTTQYSLSHADIVQGFSFDFSTGVLLLALSVYGYTGVNSSELTAYTYWCVEKGYPARIGMDRTDPQWPERARGWLKVMQMDVVLTMVLLTCATLPFYVLGAGVLHELAERPSGTTTIASLANMFSAVLGNWATVIFGIGAFFILFSSIISGIGAGGRGFADYLATLGVTRRTNLQVRMQAVRAYVVVIPLLAFILYLTARNPVFLVTIGALTAAIMSPIQCGAVLWLQRHHMDERVRPSRQAHWFLVVTFVFQACMAAVVVNYVIL
jgi:manganese transport protein